MSTGHPDPGAMDKTLSYFREVVRVLEDDDTFGDAGTPEHAENRGIFLQNVFSELDGLEHRLACSHDGSVLVERLLGAAAPHQLAVFGAKIGERTAELVRHRYASHVLEAWIRASVPHREASVSAPVPGIGAQLDALAEALAADLPDLMADAYGSRVLRVLADAGYGETFVGAVLGADVLGAAESPQGSAFLQALLGLGGGARLAAHLLNAVFGVASTRAGRPMGCDAFAVLADTDGGSRLAEALLRGHCDAAARRAVWATHVRPRLGALLAGRRSNFVVAAAAGCPADAAHMAEIVGDLLPHAAELVAARRHAVLVGMSEWLASSGEGDCGYIALLRASLDAPDAFLFGATLSMVRGGQSDAPVHPAGVRVLVALFSVASVASVLAAGAAALSAERVCALARDALGSRVLEALLRAPGVPEQHRAAVAKAVLYGGAGAAASRPVYAAVALATHASGSHVLEALWAGTEASVELRAQLLAQLSTARLALGESPHGRAVVAATGLDAYMADPAGWVRSASARGSAAPSAVERKRAAFDELLADDRLLVGVGRRRRGERRSRSPGAPLR